MALDPPPAPVLAAMSFALKRMHALGIRMPDPLAWMQPRIVLLDVGKVPSWHLADPSLCYSLVCLRALDHYPSLHSGRL